MPAGRPKGSLNRENKLLREMILEALDQRGGVEYLTEKAESHPQAFMSLLAKVLPMQVIGNGEDGEHTLVVEWRSGQ